jgi:hypothetical protein
MNCYSFLSVLLIHERERERQWTEMLLFYYSGYNSLFHLTSFLFRRLPQHELGKFMYYHYHH